MVPHVTRSSFGSVPTLKQFIFVPIQVQFILNELNLSYFLTPVVLMKILSPGSLNNHPPKRNHKNPTVLEFDKMFQDNYVTPRIPARPDWRIRTGFRDARLRTGTLYLIFFFFKTDLVPVGMAHIL